MSHRITNAELLRWADLCYHFLRSDMICDTLLPWPTFSLYRRLWELLYWPIKFDSSFLCTDILLVIAAVLHVLLCERSDIRISLCVNQLQCHHISPCMGICYQDFVLQLAILGEIASQKLLYFLPTDNSPDENIPEFWISSLLCWNGRLQRRLRREVREASGYRNRVHREPLLWLIFALEQLHRPQLTVDTSHFYLHKSSDINRKMRIPQTW